MKQIFLFCCLVIAGVTYSQDCGTYYFLQNNKTVEMTIYNKKGEPSGKQVYAISDIKNSGDAATGTLNSELFDKKGKTVAKSKGTIQCKSGIMMVDMKMNIPPQQAEQFKDADLKADNFYIEYPSKNAVINSRIAI